MCIYILSRLIKIINIIKLFMQNYLIIGIGVRKNCILQELLELIMQLLILISINSNEIIFITTINYKYYESTIKKISKYLNCFIEYCPYNFYYILNYKNYQYSNRIYEKFNIYNVSENSAVYTNINLINTFSTLLFNIKTNFANITIINLII
ncbi:Protein CbiG [Candidatus Johnevansia muelleri]|uniref:Protein CbiG n=1 Tax=Candidatus Johnevansia muelleri TaxID=1495769 RepID=A0A078KBM9_9GAMM|nr:Protein CbiG [Candidatus Evansia muelleri]